MEPIGPVRLCKDCKYFREGLPLYEVLAFPTCDHPAALTDLVYGKGHATCDLMRSHNCLIPSCGVAGKWFELKEQE